jgi:type VI secretion system secreted protein Hcp
MPIYMNYDDKKIKGDVSADAYKDWIEVNSFQWGVGRGISTPVGKDSDRESSAPSVSEITLTKIQDAGTIELLEAALHGEGVKVIIDFVKTDNKKLETYLSYTLEDVLISGYSVSSGGDRPSESLSLNFTKIECKYTPMKSKNETGDPKSTTYSLTLGKIV